MLLCGVFVTASISASPDVPAGFSGLLEGNFRQVVLQLYGIAVTVVWCGLATLAILKVVGFFVPLRASSEDERVGLDIALHGESLQ